jgi:hypothetical protein
MQIWIRSLGFVLSTCIKKNFVRAGPVDIYTFLHGDKETAFLTNKYTVEPN